VDPSDLDPTTRRRLRERRAERVAAQQAGVVSRSQLYAAGFTRGEVRAQVAARRWQLIGRHCIGVHTGPLSTEAQHWVAFLEAGPRALIDGESSLVLGGLERYHVDRIRVSVPRGARIRHRGTTVNIRQTRRWDPTDRALGPGVPRTRNAVAAVRAALWARSDRQATLVLTMSVQQAIASPAEIGAELLRVRRDRRRLLVNEVVLELAGGIRSTNELDVLRGCRQRGIPEPDRQAVRRTATGSYFLDFRWSRWGVALEVDGIQHAWAEQLVGDALRHNSIALTGDLVLRLPVLGLRTCPDDFFDQLIDALESAGCQEVMRRGRPGSQVV
jgi:hypothetical protein